MLIYILILIIAYGITFIEKKAVHDYYGGLMSLPQYYKGEIFDPYQYRCLWFWIFKLFKINANGFECRRICEDQIVIRQGKHYEIYWFIVFIMQYLSLLIFYFYIKTLQLDAVVGVLLFALFLLFTFYNDYPNQYVEIIIMGLFLCFMMWGNYEYILFILLFLGMLNRETMFLCNIIWLFYSNNWIFFIIGCFICGIGYYLPRMIYGKKKKLCSFFNWNASKTRIQRTYGGYTDQYGFYSRYRIWNEYNLFGILLVGYLILSFMTYSMMDTFYKFMIIIMGIFMVLISIPGEWREIRIYTPVLFVIIPQLLLLLKQY